MTDVKTEEEKPNPTIIVPGGYDNRFKQYVGAYTIHPDGSQTCRIFPGLPDDKQPAVRGKRMVGRPALNIDRILICDTLRNSRNVKAAAVKLGCSRGYIYKIAGADTVRGLVKL